MLIIAMEINSYILKAINIELFPTNENKTTQFLNSL